MSSANGLDMNWFYEEFLLDNKKSGFYRRRIERHPKLHSCEIMKCSDTEKGMYMYTKQLYIESIVLLFLRGANHTEGPSLYVVLLRYSTTDV
jgi:hypothetical protein